jgi:UDP-GlcNAc3NAcA epimerase
MSDVFFEELELPKPAHNLGINNLGHGAMTGRMMEKIEALVIAEKPDMILIYGDTNSTLAGALVAAKLHISLAHIEAGLRSFNRRMPEEINRVVADHLSTLLFCPTTTAVANLRAEGITKGVYAVGDVMFDATLAASARAEANSRILTTLSLTPKTYAVATIHRAENTDDPAKIAEIMSWLATTVSPNILIMPIHPRTRKLLNASNIPTKGIKLIEPLGYLDMTKLVHNATGIFTDSGGLQKEAYFHRVPCVTLRDETEWVETTEAGWNRLWREPDTGRTRRDILDYGDGYAANLITKHIVEYLKL